MRVSPAITEPKWQRRFFDTPLGNHGHRRNVVGDLIEVITCSVLRGKRHKCSGNFDYCPDVSVGGNFFECKAIGRSRQTFVYEGRLLKDRKFARFQPLYYAVWHHTANTLYAHTVEQLQCLVLAKMRWMALIPFAEIDRICSLTTATRLNSKYGKSSERKLYGSGFRISLSSILPYKALEWELDTENQLIASVREDGMRSGINGES